MCGYKSDDPCKKTNCSWKRQHLPCSIFCASKHSCQNLLGHNYGKGESVDSEKECKKVTFLLWRTVHLFSIVVISLSDMWQWLQKKWLYGVSRGLIMWYRLLRSFWGPKSIYFPILCKFYFQWYVILLFLKKKSSVLVQKIEALNCCAISPVAQGYKSGIRLIWCLRKIRKFASGLKLY